MPEVVTLGETMVVFDGNKLGPLKYISTYERHTGGAETNVAVGLVRLGHSAGWISRVGDDPFGQHIISFFRGEGVEMSQVITDPDNPTGLFFRQRLTNGESRNYYYRKGSAASCLSPQDLSEEYISTAKFLHLTGITAALSDSCLETMRKSIRIAKKHKVKVSFDPNIRLKLWPDKSNCTRIMLELMEQADIVLPGIEECQVLFGSNIIEEIIPKIENLGVETIVIKLGDKGAIAKQGKEYCEVEGFKVPVVVDTFGAGDAFSAGFLSGCLKGYDLKQSLIMANATGAFTVTIKGNVEALPSLKDLEMFIGGMEEIKR